MGGNMTAYKNTGFALTKIKKIIKIAYTGNTPNKNKENSPLRLPLEGERITGEGREMLKNYRKLKKIIISPKCPKTIPKKLFS